MRKRILTLATCAALCCLGVLTVAAKNAQAAQSNQADAATLNGTWQCVSHGGDQGNMNFTLTFQQNGQDISGHVSSQLGDADFSSGTFKNNHLHFVIQGDSDSYNLNADYKGGKLTGTWATTVSGHKGTWEGQKAPASKP